MGTMMSSADDEGFLYHYLLVLSRTWMVRQQIRLLRQQEGISDLLCRWSCLYIPHQEKLPVRVRYISPVEPVSLPWPHIFRIRPFFLSFRSQPIVTHVFLTLSGFFCRHTPHCCRLYHHALGSREYHPLWHVKNRNFRAARSTGSCTKKRSSLSLRLDEEQSWEQSTRH